MEMVAFHSLPAPRFLNHYGESPALPSPTKHPPILFPGLRSLRACRSSLHGPRMNPKLNAFRVGLPFSSKLGPGATQMELASIYRNRKDSINGTSSFPERNALAAWKSWLSEETELDGEAKQRESGNSLESNSRSTCEMNIQECNGCSAVTYDGFSEASGEGEQLVATEVLSGTSILNCESFDWSEEQKDQTCSSSKTLRSRRWGSNGRQVLVFVGSAILTLGVGLRLSQPALAKSMSSTATSSTVENLEMKSGREGMEADGKGEEEPKANSQLPGETQADVTEAVGTEEGLGEDFWDGIETPKDSPELALKLYLERHPKDRRALEALLHTFLEKQDLIRGLKILELLVRLEPDEVEWKFMKAHAHECVGELQMAREGFEELVKLRPLSARALQGIVMVMNQTGEETTALDMVESALTRAIHEKRVVEARNLRMLVGQFHTIKGHLGEALQQYKYMIDEDPNDFRPYLCQGLVYSIMGEKDKAEQQFKKYRELCPRKFPNRSYLDELMLKAKTQSRKMHDLKQKAFEQAAKGKRPPKPMKQPNMTGKESLHANGLGEEFPS